jgi:iron complex transport system ATP-binding protein
MAQEPPPAPGLLAAEVVMLSRLACNPSAPSAADEQAVARALAKTGAAALAAQPWDTLSGGQRQRVHLARALAQVDPSGRQGGEQSVAPVLLLDEPVANADPRVQHLVLERVAQQAQQGAAVWLVLHDLALAARYAHRVLVLQNGRAIAQGPPGAVLTPALVEAVWEVSAEFISLAHRQGPAVWTGPLSERG